MKAPLVPVTVAFLIGILLGEYAAPHPMGLAIAGLVSAGAVVWGRRRAKSRVLAVLLLWGCLGALRMAVWEQHPDAGLTELLSDDPQPVQLHGVVVDDPSELFEPGEAPVPAERTGEINFDRQVCVVALQHVRMPVPEVPGTGGTGTWQSSRGRVRATIYSPRQLVCYGDEIVVEGEWSRVPAPGNPGQYDWRSALARKRIHGLLRVRPFDGVAVLRRGRGNPALAAVIRLRHRWEQLIRTHFSPRDAGFLLGLLLGQRAEIDEDLKDAFVETGTIHLLVISGFNVGVIALLLEALFRLAGLPWRMRLVGSAAGLGGYCLLTGMQPPVVRATLMAWIALGSYALDRVISWPNTLAAAALVILWINPLQLFDPGFQLSFGAVASLLALTPRWLTGLERRLGWLRPAWLCRYGAISVSATGAIWVGLAPVLAWYVQLISPVSMVANLVVTPLISALVFVGTAVLVAGALFEAALQWGAGILTALLEMTLRCVSWCRSIPGGFWYVAQPSPWLLAGYYGLLGLSLFGQRLGWGCGRLAVLWAAGFALGVWSAVAVRALDSRWLRVDVLDVGHGDSIVVRLPRGHILLVDAGTEEAGRFRVVPFLRAIGAASLDALVLTHADEDHVGGAAAVLGAVPVKALLTNGARGDTMSARRVHRLAAMRGVPHIVAAAGMVLHGGAGASIEVLHPPRGLVPGVRPESNDNSLVLKLTKGSVSILLTGDIEEAGLPWLLGAGQDLRAAALKVPHHGSRLGGAGEALLRQVNPTVALLSVGRAHGLPAPEIVRALERAGVGLYTTRWDGAIHARTDGRRLEVRTFRSRRRRRFE